MEVGNVTMWVNQNYMLSGGSRILWRFYGCGCVEIWSARIMRRSVEKMYRILRRQFHVVSSAKSPCL